MASPSLAAHLPHVRYLCVAGGGVRGFDFVGALLELAARGYDWGVGVPCRLQGVGGTSVGALFAFMVALGMSARDIAAHALRAVVDPPTGLAGGGGGGGVWASLLAVGGTLGLNDGTRLRAYLAGLLRERTGADDCTLAQFRDLTGVDLVVVATDVTACGARYLRASTDGDMSVLTALAASMCVPLLYAPVRDAHGHLLVDGGLVDNFPVLAFPAHAVLGLGLTYNIPPHMEGFGGYMRRLMAVATLGGEVAAWAALPPAYRAHCLVLDTAGEVALPNATLEMEPARARALILSGMQQTRRQLDADAAPSSSPPPTTTAGVTSLPGDVAHCLLPEVLVGRTLPLYFASLGSKTTATASHPPHAESTRRNSTPSAPST